MMSTLAAGLVVKVTDKATRVLTAIGGGFDRLKARGAKLRAGMSKMSSGLSTFAMAAGVLVTGLGFMASKAANFEQQMSAVRSVMQGATQSEMTALTAEIKRLGATTSKSATEAAEGAEFLARAGFSAEESIAALGGVISAAEADGLDLASATNIVANSVRAFGLEAGEATKVADVLALTSARTNTNMTQLGEGLKYAAPVARQLGQSINDTSMALGLLANAGLQGSVGGTALKSMMLKLADPTDDMKGKFNDLGIQVQDAQGNMLPMTQVIENIAGGVGQLGGNMEQTAFLSEAFGIRGQAAAGNLAQAFGSMQTEVADANGNMVTQFQLLRQELENADGAAKRMADERLNNLWGAFTLLGSAIEGVAIEAFSGPLSALTPMIKESADALSKIAEGMQGVETEGDKMRGVLVEMGMAAEKPTNGLVEFGRGMMDAVGAIKQGIEWVAEMKTSIMSAFGESSVSARSMGKFAVIALGLFAVFGVLAGAAAMVVVPLVVAGQAILTGLAAVAGAMAPVIFAVGLFVAYIQSTRREGQSFGARLVEVFSTVKQFALDFAQGVREGWEANIAPAFAELMAAGTELRNALVPAFQALGDVFGEAGDDGQAFGDLVTIVLAGVINIVSGLTSVLAPVMGWVAENFFVPFAAGIQQILGGFLDIRSGATDLKTGLSRVLKGVINVLLNTVLKPYKVLLMGVFAAMNYVGLMGDDTYAAMQSSLNAQPGTLLGNDAESKAAGQDRRGASREAEEALAASRQAGVAGNQSPDVNVNMGETKLTGCLESNLKVDGRDFTIASEEVKFELAQRGGFGLNPWQQGQISANGAVPAGAF